MRFQGARVFLYHVLFELTTTIKNLYLKLRNRFIAQVLFICRHVNVEIGLIFRYGGRDVILDLERVPLVRCRSEIYHL